MAIKELIEDTRAFKTWVNPILCFSRADVRCYEAVNDVEITNLGSLRRTIVNHPIGHSQFSLQRVNSISYFLEKHLGVAPAAKPGMPPAEPRKLKRVLDPARLFVAGYALFLLVISVVFADSTALLFERAASFYRLLGSAANYLS